MARVDPYLHDWDERFHALVAKNMMHHPFKPMLIVNDWLDYNYTCWTANHIWLHKQPLFLWQMALSMKLFGVSEFAIRYPGVLMGTLSILLVYRISGLTTNNKYIAFIAALLTCFSYYQLQLTSGIFCCGQNDVAFDFYVLASIWAYAEYNAVKIFRYAVLAGLFAGCAILNKWLVGLLVFSVWGIELLLNSKKENFKNELRHYLVALAVCALVALPWQVYTLCRFNKEAAHELKYDAMHIGNVVEGHSGNSWFYLASFGDFFGGYLSWLLPVGLLLILFLKRYRNRAVFSLVLYFFIPFIFFSFIAQTKMPAYFMVAAPFGYIFIAIGIFHIISIGGNNKYLSVPAMTIAALLMLNLPEITYQHDLRNEGTYTAMAYSRKGYNISIYKNIRKYLPPNVRIVMGIKDYIDLMFYGDSLDAYEWMLSEQNMDRVKKRHVPVAIFQSPVPPPAYIANYDSLYIIPVQLKQ